MNGRLRIKDSDAPRLGRVAVFFITAAVVMIVALVTIVFVVRTEGGSAYIEGKLENVLGMEMAIEKARIVMPYQLEITSVVSKGFLLEAEPGFKAQKIRLSFGFRKSWKVIRIANITIDSGELKLVSKMDGDWMPMGLAKLGDMPAMNIADISRISASLRELTEIHLNDGRIKWINSKGETKATAMGIEFDLSRINFPDKEMYFYHLGVYNVVGIDGDRVHDVERTWLASEIDDYIEIERSQGHVSVNAGDFWEKRREKKNDQR